MSRVRVPLLLLATMLTAGPAFADAVPTPTAPVAPTSEAECTEFAAQVRQYESAASAAYAACKKNFSNKYSASEIDKHSHGASCHPNSTQAILDDCQSLGEAAICTTERLHVEVTQCQENVKAFLNGKEPAGDASAPPKVGTSLQPEFDKSKTDEEEQAPPDTNPPKAPKNPLQQDNGFLHQFEDDLTLLEGTPDLKAILAFNDAVVSEDDGLREQIESRPPPSVTPPTEHLTYENMLAALVRMKAKKPLPSLSGIPTAASEIPIPHSVGSGNRNSGGGGGYSSACGNPYGGPSAPSGAYICSNRGELLACRCGGGRCGLISTGSFLCSRAGAVVR
jgi:hypothetical protein